MYKYWCRLFTAAVFSVDAFAAGVAYGVRNIKFSLRSRRVFAAVCLLSVMTAVFAGSLPSFFDFGKRLGGIMLAAVGAFMILQQFDVFGRLPFFELLSAPKKRILTTTI